LVSKLIAAAGEEGEKERVPSYLATKVERSALGLTSFSIPSLKNVIRDIN